MSPHCATSLWSFLCVVPTLFGAAIFFLTLTPSIILWKSPEYFFFFVALSREACFFQLLLLFQLPGEIFITLINVKIISPRHTSAKKANAQVIIQICCSCDVFSFLPFFCAVFLFFIQPAPRTLISQLLLRSPISIRVSRRTAFFVAPPIILSGSPHALLFEISQFSIFIFFLHDFAMKWYLPLNLPSRCRPPWCPWCTKRCCTW